MEGEICSSLLQADYQDSAPNLYHQLLASSQLSRKWFYIASAYRHPEYNQSARTFQTAFFYFDPDYTEDRLPLREYSTV